jgi:hypothetical protein
VYAALTPSSTGRTGGGTSNGNPIAVMLDARTMVRMPARCAANSTSKLARVFCR